MKILLYKATDPEKRKVSHQEIGRALSEFPPGEYVVKITKNRNIRSMGANAFYHVVLSIYATHTGHYIDELKKEFYDKIGYFEIFEDKRGKQTKRYKSSSDEDTSGMSKLINQVLQWGREEFPDVKIPQKQDVDYLRYMEVENDYNKTFSGW